MLTVAKQVPGAGFGSKLREYREAIGYTQKELGEMVDMHGAAIARIELGATPTWQTAVKIARALGKSLDDFVHEDAG